MRPAPSLPLRAAADTASPPPRRWIAQLALLGVVLLGHVQLLGSWSVPSAVAAEVQPLRPVRASITVVTADPAEPSPSVPVSTPARAKPQPRRSHPVPPPLRRPPPSRPHGPTAPLHPHAAPSHGSPLRTPLELPLAPPAEHSGGTSGEASGLSPEAVTLADPAQAASALHGAPFVMERVASSPATVLARQTPPPSASLQYHLQKGLLSGTGRIEWVNNANSYRLRLEARVPVLGAILVQTSEGRLDSTGVAPVRHTERILRRSERAVSFVRDTRPRIMFSAREGEEPLRPGAQDRLSWIAQLSARWASPPPGGWSVGQRLEMDVASAGGALQHWVFSLLERDADGLWHLQRDPESPQDTHAEVWLDPQQSFWPRRLRLVEPGADALELTLESLSTPA